MNIKNLDFYVNKAVELFENGKSFTEVENVLKDLGADVVELETAIKAVKKKNHQIKSKAGVKKLGIALLFLLSGFVITVFNFHSNQSFTTIMYSFTTVGLILLFWGLYEIIG